jgi:two-component system, response regulator YesN
MYRILIADDEAYVRDLIAKSINLSTLEVEVVGCAEDGIQAIQMIEQFKPDILITDICMPQLSGLELIKAVKETGVALKTVIISGYDDFAYAKTAMELGVTNYLLKPFLPEELFEVLGKLINEIENNASLLRNMLELQTHFEDNLLFMQERFLKNILLNKSEKKNLIEEGRAIKLDLKARYYCCTILKLLADAVDTRWSFSSQALIEDFLRIIKDEYFDSDMKAYAVGFHDRQLTILFCSNHADVFDFYTGLRTGMEKMNQSFQKYYNIKLLCSVGKIYSRPEQLSNSYEEALLVTKTMIPGQNCVMKYEEAKQLHENRSKEQTANIPQELEAKLILNIRLARKDKALAILNDIIKYYEMFYLTAAEYVNMSIFGLVFSLDNAMMESGSSFRIWQDEKMKQYFKNQLQYGTLYDTKLMLENYVTSRCDEFSLIISNQSDKLVYDIKTLIEHNLANEEFNLESASSQLFFSANYVRQIFKQKTGEGFTEYLIQKRMERAAELLQDPTYKVQDVAQSTGYSSQRYFSSVFKKFYGCTPSEYREQLLKD